MNLNLQRTPWKRDSVAKTEESKEHKEATKSWCHCLSPQILPCTRQYSASGLPVKSANQFDFCTFYVCFTLIHFSLFSSLLLHITLCYSNRKPFAVSLLNKEWLALRLQVLKEISRKQETMEICLRRQKNSCSYVCFVCLLQLYTLDTHIGRYIHTTFFTILPQLVKTFGFLQLFLGITFC